MFFWILILGLAAIESECGAQFVFAIRLWAIGKRFVGERILLRRGGKLVQIGGEHLARAVPALLNLLRKFRERADGALVGLNQTLSSRAPQNMESQDDDDDHGNRCGDGRPGISIHRRSWKRVRVSRASPCNTRKRRRRSQARSRPLPQNEP